MSIFLLFVSDIYDFFGIHKHSDFCNVVLCYPLLIYIVSTYFYQLDVYLTRKVVYFVLWFIFRMNCVHYVSCFLDGSASFLLRYIFFVSYYLTVMKLCWGFVQWSCGCWLAVFSAHQHPIIWRNTWWQSSTQRESGKSDVVLNIMCYKVVPMVPFVCWNMNVISVHCGLCCTGWHSGDKHSCAKGINL